MADPTHRIQRDIQHELADMRDDRTVVVAILNRLDASVTSLNAEVRALRSQFDRFRNEVRASVSKRLRISVRTRKDRYARIAAKGAKHRKMARRLKRTTG